MSLVQNSFFAPAQRKSLEEVLGEHDILLFGDSTCEVLDALHIPAAIINDERQLVFVNKLLLEFAGFEESVHLLGKRFGEALNCIHSSENSAGCGTSEHCRYCGSVQAVVESMAQSCKVTKECRVTARKENSEEMSFDLLVTASPLVLEGKRFTIVSIEDISDQKRRRLLERIFFHDIINTAGALKGLLDLCKDDPQEIDGEVLSTFVNVTDSLLEEIFYQRQLSDAENGELDVHVENVSVQHILEETIKQGVHSFAAAKNVKIELVNSTDSDFIRTDPVLLRRVLFNLLKNAFEAASTDAAVTAGCTFEKDAVTFLIHNSGYMPHEIQMQLFKRSFSTKGIGRGAGTYSVKMLTERYLKGTVSFEFTPENGTIFRIRLPKNLS